ncbi:hypothetical protein [Brevundimonas sp. SPF441]|jgi:hypothetical protein|uniref:Uncharacterized protein n=2 Tax=root TaxID=1 RepID=A0A6H1ZMI9_9ZZZZ|nr:hypothetical protein [Brevundimonas sp. SPF441]MBU1384793.1 hypothetical protein [Alphaproteobacteria bacterium]MBU2272008.1 hypothetical protein [Alphaproteobacteria bacterium]MBU2419553.1 hypothetical protein [Alphaproteobacteria bacterium]MRL68968.1 hypothetical protein [Brevundimonas sp. SPF441]
MQFVRKQRHGPRVITPRQLSAYERSCRAKREKLPLLAPLIAEAQLPAEEEMARRQAGDIVWEQSARDAHAAKWREVRTRLFALPDHARAAVLARYNSSRWFPRNPGLLASLIWDTLKGVAVPASTLVPMPAAERLSAVAALNDRARAGDTNTRCRRAYSPGAMAFLAPGFVPDEEYERPQVYLHVSRGRWCLLWDGVADFVGFTHNIDPSGERRCGVFSALGTPFRFEVFYLSHQDDGDAVAPWNSDLSRRVVWVGCADEIADLSQATFESGWTP